MQFMSCLTIRSLKREIIFLPGNVVWQAHELTPCCIPCFEAKRRSLMQSEWTWQQNLTSNPPTHRLYVCRSCLNNCNSVRLPPVFVCLASPSILLVFFCVFCPALPQLSVLYLGPFLFPGFLSLVLSGSPWAASSCFLLCLSPPSSFFLLSVRSLLGALAVTPPKKSQGHYTEAVAAHPLSTSHSKKM